MATLSQQQIDQFIDVGYVKIEQAFSRETADQCRAQLWQAIGLKPDKPVTWTQPVIRVGETGPSGRNAKIYGPAIPTFQTSLYPRPAGSGLLSGGASHRAGLHS